MTNKKGKVELTPGDRVQSRHFAGNVRAVLSELRRANMPASIARLYSDEEKNFGLVTTDDGQTFWDMVTNLEPLRSSDVYEEGHSDPEAFWARVMKLPLLGRAQEVARAIGNGGMTRSVSVKEPAYPPAARRTAGFLSALSIERVAQVIGAAFPKGERSKKFADWAPFEKSGREFDASEWKPFQGQKSPKFHPSYVVGGLVGGLAWRVAHDSEATKKSPSKLVSKAALAALEALPEATVWLPFFAHAKPLRGQEVISETGKFGLPGKVVEGSGV